MALGSLALVLAFGSLTLAQIVIVAFVEGSLFVFFSLAESAALPQVVPKEQLPTAVAQNQARVQGADLVGQPLGGALFGISRLPPFAADAVSYAVSFVSLLFVRPAFQEEHVPAKIVIIASLWIWALAALALPVFRSPLALGAVWGFAGFFGPVFNVTFRELPLRARPRPPPGSSRERGPRGGLGSDSSGPTDGGVFAQSLGAVKAIVALGGVMVAVGVAATASRSIRRAPPVEELLALEPVP